MIARPLIGPVTPLALTTARAGIGGIALLAISLALEPVSAATITKFATPAAVGSLTFLSILGTIVAYTIYLTLLREWGTIGAGMYAFVSPIVALAIGVWWFGETIGEAEVAGTMLLLLTAAATALLPNESKQTSPVRWSL